MGTKRGVLVGRSCVSVHVYDWNACRKIGIDQVEPTDGKNSAVLPSNVHVYYQERLNNATFVTEFVRH